MANKEEVDAPIARLMRRLTVNARITMGMMITMRRTVSRTVSRRLTWRRVLKGSILH
jgi:hypothetical protein